MTGMEVVEEVAEQGLHYYVQAVADGLGVRSDAVCHVPRPRASAYLALPERLPDFAGREVAVLWDAHHGWGLGVETSSGEDLIMLAYLGEDVLPEPDEVVAFVRTLLRGRRTGQLKPPIVRRCDLRAGLARYVPPDLTD
jgi:hypothetical protein